MSPMSADPTPVPYLSGSIYCLILDIQLWSEKIILAYGNRVTLIFSPGG